MLPAVFSRPGWRGAKPVRRCCLTDTTKLVNLGRVGVNVRRPYTELGKGTGVPRSKSWDVWTYVRLCEQPEH